MPFTRKDSVLAEEVIASRPGKSYEQKLKNAQQDASRKRKGKQDVSEQKFLSASLKKRQHLDIRGFDDGKDSKFSEHIHNEVHERMKRLREIKAEKRKKLIKESKKISTHPARYRALKRKMEESLLTGKLFTPEEREEYHRITPYDLFTDKYVGYKKRKI
jgi:hypothetical protein